MKNVVSFGEWFERGLEDKIYDLTENGECARCGNCCTNLLPMNKQEVERIKKYVLDHDIKPYEQFAPYRKLPYNNCCPFYNEDKKICTVYDVRPKICRLFICNKPEEAKRNTEKYHKTMTLINARKEFFK
jgi:Fe-S-cluster containining protein